MERRTINPWTWQEHFGFVQGHECSGAQRMLYCAGQTSVDAEGAALHVGDMARQIAQALDNVERVLDGAGLNLSHVVRLNYYTTDIDAFLQANQAIARRLGQAGCQPASTLLGVARLARPEFLVEIEATAVA
jgi:enamine deaminase RidA (YjgF/YER057c/UK114 family)